MKKIKKTMLTQAEYDALAKSTDWRKVELNRAAIQGTPGIERKADFLGAFQSGDANAVKNLNGRQSVLGMDYIIREGRPKWDQGEWWVNVYHYVITKTNDPTLPYCLEGPFNKETLMGHWPTSLDLSPYEEPKG